MPRIHRSSHDPTAFHCGSVQYKSELSETDPTYRTPEPRYRLLSREASLERQQFVNNSMALYHVEQRGTWLPKNDPPLSRDVFGVKLSHREPYMQTHDPGAYDPTESESYLAQLSKDCPYHGLKLTEARLGYLRRERLHLNTAWIPEIQQRQEQLKPCGEKYRRGTKYEEDNVYHMGYGADYFMKFMGQFLDGYVAAVDSRVHKIDAEIQLLEMKERQLIRIVDILKSNWLKVNMVMARETGTDLKQTRRDSFDSSTKGTQD